MYRVENGILYHHGKPAIALGQSYFPSYHPQKVPVPPEGDRIGEMRQDIKAIRDAGFNMVRMAALGDVRWDGQGDAHVDFPLPDAFCEACGENDLAAMIRLQGYSMNLRGFDDAEMLDQDGEKMRFYWGWFVRNCLCHPGIYEDNVAGTVASAAHFKAFPAVVSFQIYNEPAYPTEGLFDYHPYTIAHFKQWLSDRGLEPTEPPRERPEAHEDDAPWVNWRLFLMERMTWYLVEMGLKAKQGYPLPETLTCHMPCPFLPGAAVRGEDFFDTAQGMDILGITHYISCRGPSYHQACLVLDAAESAAALFGKHAWLIEYNARTNMPPQEWHRETYAAMGRAFKGILYYQWRADFPYPGSPEPEAFGMLFNDRRKSTCYDAGISMNACINRLTEAFATAEKARSGLAILWSAHANAVSDAQDNRGTFRVADCRDRFILATQRAYSSLTPSGVVVDFVRGQDLAENTLAIKVLVLPMLQGLSQEELDQIHAFAQAGGRVYVFQDNTLGFLPLAQALVPLAHGVLSPLYDSESFIQVETIPRPARITGAPFADARLLVGQSHALVCIANYDPLERSLEGTTLVLESWVYHNATVFAPDLPEDGIPLNVQGNTIALPLLSFGAYVLLT